MNDMTAVIGLEQLKYVSKTIERHQANAARFNEAFDNLKTVRPLKYKNDRSSVYWLYTLRVRNRKKFMEHMKKAGIVVSKVHARNDTHTMFKDFRMYLPGVDEFNSEQVSIPVGWWLKEKELARIINAVLKYERYLQPRIHDVKKLLRKYERQKA
jgi:dTDP-4-amino-4,6-dideoxygalactose transaminase